MFFYVYCIFQAENPPYWSVTEWCEGFMQLLDHMDIKQVHLFGASLGNLTYSIYSSHSSLLIISIIWIITYIINNKLFYKLLCFYNQLKT